MKIFHLIFSERNLYCFLWFLYLFLNLISRIIYRDINWFMYVIFFIVLFLVMRHFKPKLLSSVVILASAYYSFFLFDSRSSISENISWFKINVIPVVAILITLYLKRKNWDYINFLNILYLPFILYGIFQAIVFYSSGKMQGYYIYLPWDVKYISDMTTSGSLANLFQPGGLLRFFGTMNAFIEYQIGTVCLLMFLWLNYPLIKNKALFIINLALMLVFQSLAIERSPIMFMIILFFVWKIPVLIKYILKHFTLFIGCLLVVIFLFAFSIIDLSDPRLGGAINRLNVALTFNFQNDEAVLVRSDYYWVWGFDVLMDNPFGVGPGSALRVYGVHNNYLRFGLAYGWFGLFALILILFLILINLSRTRLNTRFFGYGLIASYCLLALFNEPFGGKLGILFFLIAGDILSRARIAESEKKMVLNESIDGNVSILERSFAGR